MTSYGFKHFQNNGKTAELLKVKQNFTSRSFYIFRIFIAFKLKTHNYFLKIFLRFWLAKSTHIIPHKHLLMTKFGTILRLMNRWRQMSALQVNTLLNEKTWERG